MTYSLIWGIEVRKEKREKKGKKRKMFYSINIKM